MEREIEILSEKTTMSVSTDRYVRKPWGVFGGKDGGNSSCMVENSHGKKEKLPYSKMTRQVNQGDIITLITPGAGGWGDPLERDPGKVLWDVTEEFISSERAEECYGVVVRKKGFRRYEIDREATEVLRGK